MEIIRGKGFIAEKAWGSKTISVMNGISTRIHWTNQPYQWHINDGEEIFTVLDGSVEMRYRIEGKEYTALLHAGDIFYASTGTEHMAHPVGEARILVVEKEDSV